MPLAKALIGFKRELREERSEVLINKENLFSQMTKVGETESVL